MGGPITQAGSQHPAPPAQPRSPQPASAQPLTNPDPRPHLMLGVSCASMSPPLSLLSSGTTTPTAPSDAASSRLSSAQVGQAAVVSWSAPRLDGAAPRPEGGRRHQASACACDHGYCNNTGGHKAAPDIEPAAQRTHRSCTLPAGRAHPSSRQAGLSAGSQCPAAPAPTCVPARSRWVGLVVREGVQHSICCKAHAGIGRRRGGGRRLLHTAPAGVSAAPGRQ